MNDVLKREVVEGDKVKETQQRLKKALQKVAKQTAAKAGQTSSSTPTSAVPPATASDSEG